MLLAIDTSTAYTGIACYDETGLLGEASWFSGRDHTTQLLPQLDLLVRHLGRSRDDLRILAVALGPGSWSGLRVGMSTAKGFALARNLPLIGIGTLDALAYQHARPGFVTCSVIRLGRERFAVALFNQDPQPPFVSECHNVTLAELSAEVRGPTLFCGDIDAEVREALQTAYGNDAHFVSPAQNMRRPGFLAELAWQRWKAGALDDRAALEPIYLGQAVKTAPNG
jgi:tRNA threonylcarbamoyladenosine biosynthesis protein TsaB